MHDKHIVFLDQYGSLGGGQQVLLELVRAAISLGYDVTVLLPNGPCVKKLRELSANVVVISTVAFTQSKKSIVDICKLLFWNIIVFVCNVRLLRRCDLVYINGLRLLPVAILSQRLLRRNAACHVHLNHGRRELGLIRRFLQHPRAQAVVVPSPFILRQLVSFDTAFSDERVRLVENGLDVRFANVAFEDRFTGKALRQVAIVGRVSPEKGQDVLPDLAQQFPDMTFHVLGDAAFSEHEFAKVLKAACPDNVIWHGWVDDLPTKISELGVQVVLVPSRVAEAAPLVPLQMISLSCLVLVRKLGAMEDLALRLGLRTFSSDAELTQTLRACRAEAICSLRTEVLASHQKIADIYDNDALQRRFQALLRTLLDDNATR